MRTLLIFILFVSLFPITNGQENIVLTLKDCYNMTRENYPVVGDLVILDAITALRVKNNRTNYYPMINLGAQATYQSEVTMIDLSKAPITIDIPTPPKDQYRATLDISQMIYDGGVTRRQNELEEISLVTDKQQVEVELYKLRELINRYYFSILLLQEQQKVQELAMAQLEERIKVAGSAVINGLLSHADLQVLVAEKIKIGQQLTEIETDRHIALASLAELMGKTGTRIDSLQTPDIDTTGPTAASRPEILLFRNQQQKLLSSGDLLKTQRMPRLSAFGQAGYGRPGLNMLSDQFDTYYIIGAKLSWNIYDWNKNSRERSILKLQSDRIRNQEAAFRQKTSLDQIRASEQMEKNEKLLEADRQLVAIRREVLAASESRLDNGTITAADYLVDLNGEKQALIGMKVHQLMLLQAKADYLVLRGY